MHISKKTTYFLITTAVTYLAYMCISACNYISTKKSQSQIELGRYLFYDRRLSVNNTKACGTCHNPQLAFTDGYKRSLGAYADLHKRNTQTLFNLSYFKYLTAGDSSIHTLIQQMNNPLYNKHPIEMGVDGNEEIILKRLANDSLYNSLFKKANYKLDWQNIKLAISQFEQTLESLNSPYDKYLAGKKNELSKRQQNGLKLFFSDKLNCSKCHGGANFATPEFNGSETQNYFNTGLYNSNNPNGYPVYDNGLFEITNNTNDIGKFRVPTLRNLAFTSPYYHDGSASNLKEVINNYAAGGREILKGENKGNGRLHKNKHELITGFKISEAEKNDLIDFLFSLSDSAAILNPSFQNPFIGDETK